jgi:glycosyltransferase involved in cell wall biosynthesis
VGVSIGILAWNEAETIEITLRSLFEQSIFHKLAGQNVRCEIICAANGCNDDTVGVTARFFERQEQEHPYAEQMVLRAADIREQGRFNAYNVFVHELSASEAEVLFLMDADILFNNHDTLWNMYQALISDAKACICTDLPIKDITFKQRKSLKDYVSLATSRLNSTSKELMTGQLHAIKAPIARNIYLPKRVGAVEDGFIKALATSYFLTREPCPGRIIQAENASHIFEAYTDFGAVLKNQKRQMIGQTIVHVLVDKYLKSLPLEKKLNMAETLRELDSREPDWVEKLVSEHMRQVRFCWQLFPGLLGYRFKRWAKLKGITKVLYLPPTIAAFLVTLISSWLAHRGLRRGAVGYWPSRKGPKFNLPAAPGSTAGTAGPVARGVA